uniref:CSON011226 protein n=1 Tax=Culicoides sonorensis TaxID=179676 RepID=A0A336KJZ4_CULSO
MDYQIIFTILVLPFIAAIVTGVFPNFDSILESAPYLSNKSIIFSFSFSTAQCSGVIFSISLAFGSHLCCNTKCKGVVASQSVVNGAPFNIKS